MSDMLEAAIQFSLQSEEPKDRITGAASYDWSRLLATSPEGDSR